MGTAIDRIRDLERQLAAATAVAKRTNNGSSSSRPASNNAASAAAAPVAMNTSSGNLDVNFIFPSNLPAVIASLDGVILSSNHSFNMLPIDVNVAGDRQLFACTTPASQALIGKAVADLISGIRQSVTLNLSFTSRLLKNGDDSAPTFLRMSFWLVDPVAKRSLCGVVGGSMSA